MGEQLDNDDEILFRQVHPNFVVDGHLSSQPFLPTDKDDNKLSVDRSTIIDAAGSFSSYTKNGHKSVAVYGLSVGEFGEHDLMCISDPLLQVGLQTANPAHAYVDYSKHGTSKQKVLAKKLKAKALARGRLHP